MKKIFILFLLYSLFHNKITAQGCSDFLSVEFDRLQYNGDCENPNIGALKVTIEDASVNSIYYSSVTKYSLNVHYSFTTNMDCGEHTYYNGTGTISVNNTLPGEHTTYFYADDCMFFFTYTYKPINPSDISFRLKNSAIQETIFNENDTIVISGGNSNAETYLWQVTDFNNFICTSTNGTILPKAIEPCKKYAFHLENLNVVSKKKIIFTVNAHTDNLYSCNTTSNYIWVYPRRPQITNIQITPPSCKGDGDGTITINAIDGALGEGTGNGSVSKYKITFAKGECPNLSGNLEDVISDLSEDAMMPFAGENDMNYIENLPITFTVDSFYQDSGQDGYTNPINGGSKYCILLENFYLNTESSGFANGCTFTEVTIPEKAILTGTAPNTTLDCNSYTNGEITLTASGGNHPYTAKLYNGSTNTGQEKTINSSGGNCTFTNLAASDNYKVQLIDAYGCNVNNTNSDYIENIKITQPQELSVTRTEEDNVDCYGNNTGMLTYNITGGNIMGSVNPSKDPLSYYNYTLKNSDDIIVRDGNTKGGVLLIENLPADTFFLTIEDANMCPVTYQNSNTFTITEPPALRISNVTIPTYAGGTPISCHNANDGRINVDGTGGTPNYTYSLFNQGGTIVSNNNGIFSGLANDDYAIRIEDTNGCIVTSGGEFTLSQPEELLLTTPTISNYNGVNISCTGYNDGWIDIGSKGGTGEKIISIENNKNANGPGPNPSPSHTFSNLSVGDKTITVIDANECTYSKTYKLTQPKTLPEIDRAKLSDYNGFFVHCKGDNDGKISIQTINNSGTPFDGENINPYLYSIDDGKTYNTSSKFKNLAFSNDYKLKIKDANNCPSATYTIDIEDPTTIITSASSPSQGNENSPYNISCNGLSDGEINLSASGGVASTYSYFYSKNGITFQPVGNHLTKLGAGNYFYYSEDANNCISETKNIELLQPDALALSYDTSNYIGNHAIRCFGLNDTLKIKPSGGFGSTENGHYKVKLNDLPDIIINSGDSIAKFVINASDDYTISITDANNCVYNYSDILHFSQPNEMNVNVLTAEPTLCHNSTDGKLNIKWQGGSENYTYYLKKEDNFIDTLYNNNTNSISTFNGLEANIYKVKATDENNCEDFSETIRITSPNQIIVEETITEKPVCFGDTLGSFNLTGNGGTTNNNIFDFYIKTSYGDSIFKANTNLATFNNIKLGTHKFFAIDDNNCLSLADSLIIDAPDELIANTLSTNVSAQGGSDGSASVYPEGGTPEYRYLWKDENNVIIGNSNNITNFPAGDYTVELWDNNDCPFHDTENGLIKNITIHEPNFALELIIEQVHNVSFPDANDGSVSLNSNGGWGQNLYKKGQYGTYSAARVYTNLSVGTYWFYVKDSYGVVDSLQVAISETPPMQITQSNIKNINCFGENNGEASFSVTGGTLPYLYSLNNIDFSENNYFENLSQGDYTIYIKDLYEYEINQNFTISQPAQALNISVTENQNTSCGASDGSATVLAHGGTSPYQYYWEELGLYNETANNLSAGTYNVTATDENLCTASVQIIINNSDGPVIEGITTTDTKCFNTTDGTANISNITASGSYTIQWSNGQTGGMTAENLMHGNYTVQVTDENDCFTTESFTINSPEDLHFSFNTTNPICYDACNGNITANISGGSTPYILEWENISGNPSTNHVSNLCADNYILNVTDANNCEYSSTAILENPEQIIILQENQATICQGQDITLNAGNEGSSYSWTGNNFQSYEQSVTLNEAGTYYVNIVTPQGCTAQDEFTLNFSNDYLQANFLMQSEAEIADTVVLVEISWEAPDSVSWYFPQELWVLSRSEENVQLIPTQSGTFTVGLTAHLGTCSDFIEKQIIITGTADKGLTKPKYFSDKTKQFQSVNLHPNPNNGYFTLDISLFEENDVLIEVYDLLGQKQQTHKIGKGEKKYTFDFNINNLKKGLYFISIKTNKGSAGIKFLKE